MCVFPVFLLIASLSLPPSHRPSPLPPCLPGIELFERADRYGHWRAAYTLAVMYADKKEWPKAEAFFRKYWADRSRWNDKLTAAAKTLEEGGWGRGLGQGCTALDEGSRGVQGSPSAS